MKSSELRHALNLLRWSQRGLAEALGCDDRLVRRWIAEDGTVPPNVAKWLHDLAKAHAALPPPQRWRRHETTATDEEVDRLPDRDAEVTTAQRSTAPGTIDVIEMTWEWRPDQYLTAKGKITIAREEDQSPPVILSFEIPLANSPQRAVMENPREWIISFLRRALRS